MPVTDSTDEELMAKYQEGSEEAFKVLYTRHSGKIYGYLKSRIRSEQEVTDLFQETFVKIHRSKHLYNRSLPVLPWLFSITHSVMIDGTRKTYKKNEVYDFDFNQFPAAVPAASLGLPSEISSLPENQQTAMQMRYVDEKTFEEIAESLKTSPANVRQLISRGIKNLKNLVKSGDDL
jgi:DNA-directed RNA polymerase specialized sigma24 family protein